MRSFFRRLLYPGPPVLAGLAVAAAALLVVSLGGHTDSGVVIYGSYLFSTYALVALCLAMPGAVRALRQRTDAGVEALTARPGPWGRAARFLLDSDQRAEALLPVTLALNLAFAMFKLATAVFYRSWWLASIGGYYAVLSVLRFNLLKQAGRRGRADERRSYRRAALALMALTVVMGGIITMTVIDGEAYDYAGVLIYAFALYAFVRVITAAMAFVKYWRTESEALAAARSMALACAMMSVMALQTALLSRFGENRVLVPAPDASGRRAILEKLIVRHGYSLENVGDLDWLADDAQTKGYSGRDLRSLTSVAKRAMEMEMNPNLSNWKDLKEVSGTEVKLRPLTHADFTLAMKRVPPSINDKMMDDFRMWCEDPNYQPR